MKTTDLLVMYAKYNKAANNAVYELLDKLSNEQREETRGSYYGSLSALARHVLGATVYFQGMFKEAVPQNAAARQALASLASVQARFEGPVTAEQWKALRAAFTIADDALVNFTSALNDADLDAPVKWFSGNPPTVPLHFMLSQLAMHNTHHRGQISQILDEMKIDHDFSGIAISLSPEPAIRNSNKTNDNIR
jgi:uncharacterized damage-inducible protein DinB